MKSLAIVLALFGVALFAYSADKQPDPPVYRYKVLFGEDNASVFNGTSIKSNGLCTEIYLNGRLDTVVCGARYVTEMLPEDKTQDKSAEREARR